MTSIKEALELAEDVLSRAPFSTRIWPNGMHPQTGITKIRDALATLSPPAGERREAIARIISDRVEVTASLNVFEVNSFELADAIIASGPVQDEAGIESIIELGILQHVRLTKNTYIKNASTNDMTLDIESISKAAEEIAAAIRSARDGGAACKERLQVRYGGDNA